MQPIMGQADTSNHSLELIMLAKPGQTRWSRGTGTDFPHQVVVGKDSRQIWNLTELFLWS